jgi:hypothetical protein
VRSGEMQFESNDTIRGRIFQTRILFRLSIAWKRISRLLENGARIFYKSNCRPHVSNWHLLIRIQNPGRGVPFPSHASNKYFMFSYRKI